MCIGSFHKVLENFDGNGHQYFYSHAFSTNEFVVGLTLAAILFFTPVFVAICNNYRLKREKKRRNEYERSEMENRIAKERKTEAGACYCNQCIEIELGIKHPQYAPVRSKREIIPEGFPQHFHTVYSMDKHPKWNDKNTVLKEMMRLGKLKKFGDVESKVFM